MEDCSPKDINMANMQRKTVSLLQTYFDFFYAKAISDKMCMVFKKKCLGCVNEWLSQTDHTCLTLTTQQLLNLYLEDILQEVDQTEILSQWNQSASILDVSAELLEMFKLKIYCKDWRDTDMKTSQWRTKMIKTAVQIKLLEQRFVTISE
jgi:hypothetical protein